MQATEQGPKAIVDMTDRQIAEETLALLRTFAEALGAVAASPMAGMMMPAGVRESLRT